MKDFFEVNCDGLSGEEWNYENHGSGYWQTLYKACAAKQQSPLNIITSQTVYYSALKAVKISNANKLLNFSVFNTGETGKKF